MVKLGKEKAAKELEERRQAVAIVRGERERLAEEVRETLEAELQRKAQRKRLESRFKGLDMGWKRPIQDIMGDKEVSALAKELQDFKANTSNNINNKNKWFN